jgi:DNA-binding response OmpR family regulator
MAMLSNSTPESSWSIEMGVGMGLATALIVEDDPDQAELVARLVRLRDLDAVVAGTGRKGLELARRIKPDVVLLDVMLPDLNGFEICQRLRGDRDTMLTPIVMLTALGDNTNRLRGFRVGANAYVAKPYGPDELFEAISKARAWRTGMEQDQIQGEIHVVLHSEIPFLQEVNDLLMSVSKAIPFSNEQVMQLRQAVMEMGQNAIEWGNRHRSEELVDITYRIHPDRVEIVVKDQGAGFDRDQLPHAATADDPIAHMDVREKLGIREGGFGLLITGGMVDEMRYNDVGNQVTLIKRFQRPEPGAN